MKQTKDILALTRLPGLTQSMTLALLREYETVEQIFAHKNEFPLKVRSALDNWNQAIDRAEVELAFCEEKNINILTLYDTDYPQRLHECPDAPPLIFYRGTANLNAQHVISVVGTRHISEYGKIICHDFINHLQKLIPDCLIISGLAYGVDINAHKASLSVGLPTVGVLAHGLDRIYPSSHRNTASEMVSHGGLLTEYFTGTNPDKGNFVRRNRIVAGMADATVVVESADKGGALITARLAGDYNRDVFAFPGRTSDPYSQGCNRLIRTNAASLITCAEDLVSAMNWKVHQPCEAIQGELFPELSTEEQLIYELLDTVEGTPVNQIVIKTNLPFAQVSGILFELEMDGLVKQMVGGKYRRV